MKKFSALLCIALFITFGGVYAAWTYSTGNVAADPQSFGVGMVIDPQTSAYGDLVVTHNASIGIDDTNSNHVTDDALAISGAFTIKFTPNAGAIGEIQQNGISLSCTLTLADAAKYTDDTSAATAIFNIANPTKTFAAGSVSKVDGSFTYTVNLADFGITLNEYDLPTPTAATTFQSKLANCFTFSVTDTTSTTGA